MISEALQTRILDGIQQLAAAGEQHKAIAIEHGEAEHGYRKAQAMKYLEIMAAQGEGKKPTEPHLKAMIDLACEKEMLRVRLAEANHEAARELVKSLQAQISALQSLLSLEKAEAEAIRYTPQLTA